MKYTGLNPTDVNKTASGSLGVFVESTQVGTFGTDSLVVSGSTTLSGSLTNIGPQTQSGSLNVVGNTTITGSTTISSSLNVIGTETLTGTLNTIGSFLTTGSAIISSSLAVIGIETVTGVLQSIGSFFSTGSAIISSSLSVIGQSTVVGTSTVTGSSLVTGSLSLIGNLTTTGSALITGSANIQGNTGINGILSITGSQYTSGSTDVNTIQGSTAGGTLLNVLGTAGQLFTVTDGLSGSLFSVNTISGLPVIEAFSDFSFVAGPYGLNNLYVGNSRVGIMTGTPSATLDVVGNTRITGSTVITGSLSIPAVGDVSLLTVGSTTSPFLLVTGSTGRVSVNTTSSVSSLNVGGTTNVLTVQGTTVEGNMFDVYGPAGQLFSVVDGLSGSLFSINTISGVPVMEAFSDNTVRIGQYANPPLVVTGSEVRISGSTTLTSANLNVVSGSITIFKSGSSSSDALFDVEGAQGQLFSVIDSFSGSLMSVNDISGFPILDVRSDDSVIMGTYGSNALVVSGSSVIIGVTGSAAPTITGSNGQIQFSVIGGNAFIYVWLGGRWRSGSLA